jgi:acetyltransferase-like isoleucine patch superfamily enzyme
MIKKIVWFLITILHKPLFGSLGQKTYMGSPLFITKMNQIFLGSKVRIYPGSRMELCNDNSSIVFKDNISIGQSLHIVAFGDLIIHKNTTISANVLISDVDHAYKNINQHILLQDLICKHTEIGENCFIGYGAVIQAGTILGKQCIVGANSVVRGTFPPYCVIVGIPGKIVKRYDEVSSTWKKTNTIGEFIDE